MCMVVLWRAVQEEDDDEVRGLSSDFGWRIRQLS